MPAPLKLPSSKVDIRLFDEDIIFLNGYTARHNTNLTVFVRDLVHKAVGLKKQALGLEDAARRKAGEQARLARPAQPIDGLPPTIPPASNGG